MASSFVQHGKKIVAICCNFAAHPQTNPTPKAPFFFLKPTTSYIPSGGKVEIPTGVIAHHEVELGLVIGKRGRDISKTNADSHVAGYALAVDMTAKNLLNRLREQQMPWSVSKGLDTFTPIGSFIPKTAIKDPHDLRLQLRVNGILKQDAMTSDMTFRIPRLIEHVSSMMTLEEGDLVLTGTPSGAGPVVAGDKVECLLADAAGNELAKLDFSAVFRQGGYQFQIDD